MFTVELPSAMSGDNSPLLHSILDRHKVQSSRIQPGQLAYCPIDS